MKLPLALALWLNLFLFTVPEPPVSRYRPSCIQLGGDRGTCGNPCGCVA